MTDNYYILCECYANKAIAHTALENLIHIRHKNYMGRDVIIEEIKTLAKKSKSENKYIAIIDKEYAGSAFIDKVCELGQRKDIIYNKIYVCMSTYKNVKVLLVVFEPNIEESFLCDLDRKICNNYRYREKIKSKEGEKYVQKLLNQNIENRKVKKIIGDIRDLILQFLKINEGK